MPVPAAKRRGLEEDQLTQSNPDGEGSSFNSDWPFIIENNCMIPSAPPVRNKSFWCTDKHELLVLFYTMPARIHGFLIADM